MTDNRERPLRKRQLVSEISQATQLKPAIVKSVLDSFRDIMYREILLYETFRLSDCFTVKSVERKERKGYNIKLGKEVVYPSTRILTISLAKKIKAYHRQKLHTENNLKNNTTTDNWHKN